jgi:hypothetical protein
VESLWSRNFGNFGNLTIFRQPTYSSLEQRHNMVKPHDYGAESGVGGRLFDRPSYIKLVWQQPVFWPYFFKVARDGF